MVAKAEAYAERERLLKSPGADPEELRDLEDTILWRPSDLPDCVAIMKMVGEIITDLPGGERHVLALALAIEFLDDLAPYKES